MHRTEASKVMVLMVAIPAIDSIGNDHCSAFLANRSLRSLREGGAEYPSNSTASSHWNDAAAAANSDKSLTWAICERAEQLWTLWSRVARR
jgi:hypothetical protein